MISLRIPSDIVLESPSEIPPVVPSEIFSMILPGISHALITTVRTIVNGIP